MSGQVQDMIRTGAWKVQIMLGAGTGQIQGTFIADLGG